jgi:hypothetical protein
VLNRLFTVLGCSNDDAENDGYKPIKESVKPDINKSRIPKQFPEPPAGSILGLIAKSNATGVSIHEVTEETVVVTRRRTVTFFPPPKSEPLLIPGSESDLQPGLEPVTKCHKDDEFSFPDEVFVMESEDERREDEESELTMVRCETFTNRRKY